MLNVSSFFAHFYIIKDDLEELIMKKIYEIILSKDEIEQSDWEELFMEVSKINGLMNTWKFYVIIEKNVFRYFVESDYDLPPILSFSDGNIIFDEKKGYQRDVVLNLPIEVLNIHRHFQFFSSILKYVQKHVVLEYRDILQLFLKKP